MYAAGLFGVMANEQFWMLLTEKKWTKFYYLGIDDSWFVQIFRWGEFVFDCVNGIVCLVMVIFLIRYYDTGIYQMIVICSCSILGITKLIHLIIFITNSIPKFIHRINGIGDEK